MWFGVFLPQLRMSFDTILERTLAAEAAGFDSVWLMDHLAAPAAPQWDTLEGWTLAAALAARTTRIRLGHLVTCDPFRHPSVLAKMAATVDVLSGGRLDLGIGWGSVDAELRAWVTFLSDDQTALDPKVVEWGKKQSVRRVPLSVFEDVVGPPSYLLSRDADVTVLLAVKQKVVRTFACRAGELNDERIADILQAVPGITKSAKK